MIDCVGIPCKISHVCPWYTNHPDIWLMRVEGGEMKWKIGATYLDTPSSPVHDDYEDIISHELEFVPKKEVTHSVVKLSY